MRAIKGSGRPINSEEDRAAVLAAMESVSFVTIFNEATPEKLIRLLRPDVLVKGGDWKVKDIVGACFVKSIGGKVAKLPFVKGRSTTGLIEKLKRL